jgi:hypothetical protein
MIRLQQTRCHGRDLCRVLRFEQLSVKRHKTVSVGIHTKALTTTASTSDVGLVVLAVMAATTGAGMSGKVTLILLALSRSAAGVTGRKRADQLSCELEAEVLGAENLVDVVVEEDVAVVDEQVEDAEKQHLPVLRCSCATEPGVAEALIDAVHCPHVTLVLGYHAGGADRQLDTCRGLLEYDLVFQNEAQLGQTLQTANSTSEDGIGGSGDQQNFLAVNPSGYCHLWAGGVLPGMHGVGVGEVDEWLLDELARCIGSRGQWNISWHRSKACRQPERPSSATATLASSAPSSRDNTSTSDGCGNLGEARAIALDGGDEEGALVHEVECQLERGEEGVTNDHMTKLEERPGKSEDHIRPMVDFWPCSTGATVRKDTEDELRHRVDDQVDLGSQVCCQTT